MHKATSSITDPDRKIFYRPTHGGECNCRLFYDGQEDLLFNVDNNQLLYYGFLLQYLHIMVEGKNPLAAFQRSCERSFSTQSLTKPIKVKLLHQAWNSFARLLDINWSDTFACPLCGPSPKVVVCDGTMLGFQKDLLEEFQPEVISFTYKSNVLQLELVYFLIPCSRLVLTNPLFKAASMQRESSSEARKPENYFFATVDTHKTGSVLKLLRS